MVTLFALQLRGCQLISRLAACQCVPFYNFYTNNKGGSAGIQLRRLLSPLRSFSAGALPHVATVEEAVGRLDKGPTVPPPNPLVVVISGPSGVGKDAVIRRLQELRPDLYFVVTATSRPVRPGEQHGVDYLFVTREEFEGWVQAGQLLEYALVYGDYKGIPRAQVEDALQRGTDVVLRLDVQGAATVRRLLPGCVSIFLVAESESELVHRLVARKTEPLDKLLVRVETARSELTRLGEFDYVVVNKDGELDSTVQSIQAIITAEKARVARLKQQQQQQLSSSSGGGELGQGE